MEKLNELVEQAKFVADWHGSDWSSALCQGKDGKQAHEIICESRGEAVISTGSNSNEASWLCDYLELCSPENILAIAEAFRALEQRSEAAEAKLAELEKQESVAEVVSVLRGLQRVKEVVWMGGVSPPVGTKIYAHPAPAADLADLVPDELTRESWRQLFINEDYQDTFRCGFSACRAAILRNIEEAK